MLNGLGDTYRAQNDQATAALCYFRAEQILKGEPGAADMRRRKEKALSRMAADERSKVIRRFEDAAAEIERILDSEDPEERNRKGNGSR